MSITPRPTPRDLLTVLLPQLEIAAHYARQIQPRIAAQPAKDAANFFGAALSDADLSIQTFVEVALLGTFPALRFYGEEYEQSYNTKYFRAIALGPQDDYLITLDPIDGTQFYLDGHGNYQIILGILNADEFEAAIALTPATKTYVYALRGEGCWHGQFGTPLEDCDRLQITEPKSTILLGWGMEHLATTLRDHYTVLTVAEDYSKTVQIPNVNGLLSGELAGAVLRVGKFIDGAALAFLAQEAGCLVTTHAGAVPPPLHACTNYERPGLLIAANSTVQQHLRTAAHQHGLA